MSKNEEIYSNIQAWIETGMDIKLGMKLHTQYSKNHANKLRLATNPNRRQLLIMYLQQIAKDNKPVETPKSEIYRTKPQRNKVYAETIEQRLQKEFPHIIFKDLPDKLKLLVLKRFDLHQDAIKFHNLMHEADNVIDRFEAAKNCITAVDENWKIWDELNNFQQTGKIAGNHADLKPDEYTDFINRLDALEPDERVKQAMLEIRRKRNNINSIIKKGLNPEREARIEFLIRCYNYVAEIAGEEQWQK